MRITLLCTPAVQHSCAWIRAQLIGRGHDVEHVDPVDDADAAPPVGHRLADGWTAGSVPDVLLALGWQAGLAGHVARSRSGVPVMLRLTRSVRDPRLDAHRLERAVAAASVMVLASSVGEAHRLADRGIRRSRLRVVPEAVDRSRFPDDNSVTLQVRNKVAVACSSEPSEHAVGSAALPMRGSEAIEVSADRPDDELATVLRSVDALVALDDSDGEVALVLRAMSCGTPIVAADAGVLSDIVADGVTGVLVPPPAVPEALHSLLADPLRRQSMGLAAVDRVRARFDTSVVGVALERALREVAEPPGPAPGPAAEPASARTEPTSEPAMA